MNPARIERRTQIADVDIDAAPIESERPGGYDLSLRTPERSEHSRPAAGQAEPQGEGDFIDVPTGVRSHTRMHE